jgi:ribonuclease J
VTTFDSNVGRIRAVADAARAAGREVVVVGRAMDRIVQVARETGYLDDVQEFRGMEVYGHLPNDKVVALCTGSQGEPRAALARIAEDEHPEVTLSRGDMVIFSSRPIPGNERAINRVINGLVSQGVEVITDRTHLVHVSGHPRRAELEDLLGWVKPQTVIPVHGEALHLAEHGEIARKLGAHVVICRNGDLIRLAPGMPSIVDEVPAGRFYKDGSLLVPAEARTVADRRRLSFSGIVVVSLPDNDADGEPMAEVAYTAAERTFEQLPRPRRRDPESVEEAVRRAVRAAVAERWGKKPWVTVHVLIV